MSEPGEPAKAAACRRLADSYLDHVLIALAAGDRGANLRNFIDPWWIFTRGGDLVRRRTKGGYGAREFNRPCPWQERERLRQFDWLSPGAQHILDHGSAARIVNRATHPPELTLIVDHAVPFAVLGAILWEQPGRWDRTTLRAFLSTHVRRAVLSLTENAALNDAGLCSAMPARWTTGADPFARYHATGIR